MTTDVLPDDSDSSDKQRPVKQVRMRHLLASIWPQETEGGIRYNTTFQRMYKVDEQWRYSNSFGEQDLLLLGKLAMDTHSAIEEVRQTSRKDPHDAGSVPAEKGAAQARRNLAKVKKNR